MGTPRGTRDARRGREGAALAVRDRGRQDKRGRGPVSLGLAALGGGAAAVEFAPLLERLDPKTLVAAGGAAALGLGAKRATGALLGSDWYRNLALDTPKPWAANPLIPAGHDWGGDAGAGADGSPIPS